MTHYIVVIIIMFIFTFTLSLASILKKGGSNLYIEFNSLQGAEKIWT